MQRTIIFKVDTDYCGALHLKKPIIMQNLQTLRGSAAFFIGRFLGLIIILTADNLQQITFVSESPASDFQSHTAIFHDHRLIPKPLLKSFTFLRKQENHIKNVLQPGMVLINPVEFFLSVFYFEKMFELRHRVGGIEDFTSNFLPADQR